MQLLIGMDKASESKDGRLTPVGCERVPGEFFDRRRIYRQDQRPPELVTTILSPTLGSPARIELNQQGRGKFDVYMNFQNIFGPWTPVSTALELAVRRKWSFYLVPRKLLIFQDMNHYVLRDRPNITGDYLSPDQQNRIKNDSEKDLRNRVRLFRNTTLSYFKDPSKRKEFYKLDVEPAPIKEQCDGHKSGIIRLRARTKKAIPESLYALVVMDGEQKLVDLQLNSVYSKKNPGPNFNFIVAADLQWGEKHSVAEGVLKFVRHVNQMKKVPSTRAAEQKPEFILLLGDIVDARYGSAGSIGELLFGGAKGYSREFLQVWTALAGLKIPVYMIPGNHDGYRFADLLGHPDADGLLHYESAFGSPYYSFHRGNFSYIMLNSYDHPAPFRTVRVTRQSAIYEITSKLNVLNWGGGIRKPQYRWLISMLRKTKKAGRVPLLFLHHDPRGAYPAIDPDKFKPDWKYNTWDTLRHYPATGLPYQRGTVSKNKRMPLLDDTAEIHGGYFTPLRKANSKVRGSDWFERIKPTIASGYPGWIKYQQEWHVPLIYTGKLTSKSKFGHLNDAKWNNRVVSPFELLRSIVNHGVAYIFKGHDNRFHKASMKKGESIFGKSSGQNLKRYGNSRTRNKLERLKLKRKMEVYHSADVSDADSDGHGYLFVKARGRSLQVEAVVLD